MKIFDTILVLSLVVAGCVSSSNSRDEMACRFDETLEQYRPLLERDIVFPSQMPYSSGVLCQCYEKGYREGWNCGILPMITITKALPPEIASNPESAKVWQHGFQDGNKAGFQAFQKYNGTQQKNGH